MNHPSRRRKKQLTESFIFLEIRRVIMYLFYTICCLMDEVSFGLRCKELTCSMLEVTEQRGREEEMSVLHGWLLWQPHPPIPISSAPPQSCLSSAEHCHTSLESLCCPCHTEGSVHTKQMEDYLSQPLLMHCGWDDWLSLQWYCYWQCSLKLKTISHQAHLHPVAARTFLPSS